jgi:hypothetical protein
MINTDVIGAAAHNQPSPPSTITAWPAPPAGIPDGSHHIWQLKLQMHRKNATVRSVGVLYDIGARLTDSNEQVSGCARSGADS